MGIIVKVIRVSGLRGLRNLEVELEPLIILTGMNNTGKTSLLKALQISFGNRQFITQDDFFVSDTDTSSRIIIDIYIEPRGGMSDFNEDWEALFTEDRIMINPDTNKSYIPLRTIVTYDDIKASFRTKQYILHSWPPFKEGDLSWFQTENGKEKAFNYEEVPFFYIDPQRDIVEDIKARSSNIGKMISKIEYNKEDIDSIERRIKQLNEKAVNSSAILSNIKSTLKELDTAMDTAEEGIEITPFTKKIRDLNKGISIYYSDKKDSFSMEYHGMGTRSWSSLLTLKALIKYLDKNAENEQTPFFPIIAIEEPEAHLHPNAQKKLYNQIKDIKGQKIISTHSPYIAASAELSQLRNFTNDDFGVVCGAINTNKLEDEDIRKIRRQVISARGEIFFSKAIIFFEGETEEQVLPILAEKYFGKNPIEYGIDFIGVGGSGNYYPFIFLAEALKIKWFIISDGEESAVKDLRKALTKLYGRQIIKIENIENIFVLDNGCDFEKYLIDNNYIEEIKSAFIKLYSKKYLKDKIRTKDGTKRKSIKTDDFCDKCSQSIYRNILRDYSGDQGFKDAIYDCMVGEKTKLGPVIADAIVNSQKELPPKILLLFDKIKDVLKRSEKNE